MKRIIAVILALTLCFCLAACSKGGSGEKEESKNKDIIVMIEATDKDAAQTAYDALAKRLDDMKKQLADYEGASIDNALANKIEILQKGNCVAFFYSDHYDEMVSAFNK